MKKEKIANMEIDAITGAVPNMALVSKERSWALETPGAKKLLAELPAEVRSKLIYCFLVDDVLTDEASEVLNFLADKSEITRIIKKTPSSAMAFEYLYHFREAKTTIDRYFIESLSGYHVYLRLRAVEQNVFYWVDRFAREGEIVMLDNIGSGPGHDVIDMLQAHPDLAEIFHARNIDIDSQALKIGQSRVNEMGLNKSFSFIEESFLKVNRRNAHIVVLVGVLCTLPYKVCLKLIKLASHYLRPGGILIYSTNQIIMPSLDPLTDFLMRLAGWCMDYKTDEESASLGKEAGLDYINQFFDEYLHFQCMTVARKPS